MTKATGFVCALAIAATSLAAHADTDRAKLDERLTNATAVLHEVMATPDKGIPQTILAGASCVVVIPASKGRIRRRGSVWSGRCHLPHAERLERAVFVQLAGGSFGFQIGGQSTDLVLVAMNQNGLQDMLKNKFKIGGDAAASAGPVGRNAQAGTDWKLNAEFLTYSRAKGLFAGIDLDGTVLSQNEDDTRTVYGSNIAYGDVLKGGVPTPADARPFVRTVAKYFVVSRDNH